MEIIGYGILLAIGFYIAPMILVVGLTFVGAIVSAIFGDKR